MGNTITKQDFVRMLNGAAAQIREHNHYLSELDAAIGDGDHGTTVLKVMNNFSDVLNTLENEDLSTILFQSGMAASSTDGGSSAPLIGSLFLGMADPAGEKTVLSADDVAEILAAGITAVTEDSKAQIGDKTMMDALLPVLHYLQSPERAKEVKPLLVHCYETAHAGAEKSKEFLAKFGRARNLGDRVIGHPDPGAYSITFIFKGFADAIA